MIHYDIIYSVYIPYYYDGVGKSSQETNYAHFNFYIDECFIGMNILLKNENLKIIVLEEKVLEI